MLGINSTAVALSLYQPGLLDVSESHAPSVPSILAASSADALAAIKPAKSGAKKGSPVKFRSLALIPPSLLGALLEDDNPTFFSILSAIKVAIAEDEATDDEEESGPDDDSSDKNQGTRLRDNAAVQYLIQWLWFMISQSEVPALNLYPTTNAAILRHVQQLHTAHITGNGPTSHTTQDGDSQAGTGEVLSALRSLTKLTSEAKAALQAFNNSEQRRKTKISDAVKNAYVNFTLYKTGVDEEGDSVYGGGIPKEATAFFGMEMRTAASELNTLVQRKSHMDIDFTGLVTHIFTNGLKPHVTTLGGFRYLHLAPNRGPTSTAPLFIWPSRPTTPSPRRSARPCSNRICRRGQRTTQSSASCRPLLPHWNTSLAPTPTHPRSHFTI